MNWAGVSYGVISRSAKIAFGTRVDGIAEGHGSVGDERQIARDRLARQRYDEAVRVLKRVSPYCHQVLEEFASTSATSRCGAIGIWRRASTPWRTFGG